MLPLSVVIIAKNEAAVIGQTIRSLSGVTDDIVVCDTGSTDNTVAVIKNAGARVESLPWTGFGNTKNNALGFAKYDWVFFIDADEPIDEQLRNSLLHFQPGNTSIVYKVRFKNYMGDKQIRFGEWGRECKTKLFNKHFTRWDNTDIHEKILTPPGSKEVVLKGYILHQLITNLREYADKLNKYADLVANKYYQNGKKAGGFKLYIYPGFQFLLNYVFRLSFLDGRIGFVTSFLSSYYSFLKYQRLKEISIEHNG